jgi:hypothetical protein
MQYYYTTQYNAEILEKAIKEQSYGSEYQSITGLGNQLALIFENELSTEDKDHLDNLVSDHGANFLSSFDYILQTTANTQEQNINFGKQLLHDWMRRNTLEGINIMQSLWVFSRFEEFTVSCDFGQKHVDLFKMFQSGALPTVYYCLLQVEPDPMTEDYHWLTAERLEWVKEKVEAYLGNGTITYIQSLNNTSN